MDKDLNLNESAALPDGDNGLSVATGGSMGGLSKADARRGYSTTTVTKSDIVGAGEEETEDFYSFFNDGDDNGGGFAGRPEGCER